MIQEYQYSFELNIKNFDCKATSNENILSSIVCFDGCEWRLHFDIMDPIRAYLKCLSSTRTSKRVPTSFKLSILKQDGSEGASVDYNIIFGDDFGGFEYGYGILAWMHKDTLISKYVRNNSVTCKVEMNIFSAKFGDPSLDESCFRLLKMDKDVTLVIGEEEIKAHRLILAQGSAFLESLLYPINGNEVTLNDCDYRATLTAVRFIYTKKCIVDPNNFREVLKIGKKFNLVDLVLACSELLTPDNVSLYCIFIGHMSFDPDVEKQFWDYAVKNISEILGSDMFWNLTDDEIMTFIGRPEIKEKVDPVHLKAITRAATVRKETMAKSVKDPLLCVICQEDKVDTLILPCNHLSLCTKDAAKLGQAESKKCPLCQGDISYFTKVYLP